MPLQGKRQVQYSLEDKTKYNCLLSWTFSMCCAHGFWSCLEMTHWSLAQSLATDVPTTVEPEFETRSHLDAKGDQGYGYHWAYGYSLLTARECFHLSFPPFLSFQSGSQDSPTSLPSNIPEQRYPLRQRNMCIVFYFMCRVLCVLYCIGHVHDCCFLVSKTLKYRQREPVAYSPKPIYDRYFDRDELMWLLSTYIFDMDSHWITACTSLLWGLELNNKYYFIIHVPVSYSIFILHKYEEKLTYSYSCLWMIPAPAIKLYEWLILTIWPPVLEVALTTPHASLSNNTESRSYTRGKQGTQSDLTCIGFIIEIICLTLPWDSSMPPVNHLLTADTLQQSSPSPCHLRSPSILSASFSLSPWLLPASIFV